jgi:hypothetical protein
MLLIIEDKDNPTEPLAEETDGGSELLYIPAVTAPVEKDGKTLQTDCELGRMLYEFRRNEENMPFPPGQYGRLVPLFLRAVSRIGQQPEYITASEAFAPSPEETGRRLSARG